MRLEAGPRLVLLFLALTAASVGLVNLFSGGSPLVWSLVLAAGLVSAVLVLAAQAPASTAQVADPLAGRSQAELEEALATLEGMPSELEGLPDLTHPSTASLASVRKAIRTRLAEMEEE